MKRYDFASLERLIPGDVSRTLNIGGSAMKTYRRDGMALNTAEKLAERAGFLVYEVWPEARDEIIRLHERECAAQGCPITFVPDPCTRPRLYCSDSCRKVEYGRRKRSTPEGAAVNRERRLRYYRENAEYERARQRRADRAAAERRRRQRTAA